MTKINNTFRLLQSLDFLKLENEETRQGLKREILRATNPIFSILNIETLNIIAERIQFFHEIPERAFFDAVATRLMPDDVTKNNFDECFEMGLSFANSFIDGGLIND